MEKNCTLPGQLGRHHDRRRHLDHDADVDRLGAHLGARAASAVLERRVEVLEPGDHREHHRDRSELRGPVDRPQLRAEQVGALEAQPDAADAEEGVVLAAGGRGRARSCRRRCRACGRSAAGRSSARTIAASASYCSSSPGRRVAAEEQELGAHQPDALGAGVDGGRAPRRRRFTFADDLDAVAVGRDRRLVAVRCSSARDALQVALRGARGRARSASLDARATARRRAPSSTTTAPAGGLEQPPGPAPTIAGMPSARAMIAVCEVGPPRGGAEADHPRRVDGRGVGRREVVGDEDRPGWSGSSGRALVGRREEAQHPLPDVAEVGGARGQQRRRRAPPARATRRLVWPPASAQPAEAPSSMAPIASSIEVGVVEERLVGAEDRGLVRRPSVGRTVVVQLAQLGAGRLRSRRAAAPLLGLGSPAVRSTTSCCAREVPQRADRDAGRGGDAGARARRRRRAPRRRRRSPGSPARSSSSSSPRPAAHGLGQRGERRVLRRARGPAAVSRRARARRRAPSSAARLLPLAHPARRAATRTSASKPLATSTNTVAGRACRPARARSTTDLDAARSRRGPRRRRPSVPAATSPARAVRRGDDERRGRSVVDELGDRRRRRRGPA